MTLLHVEPDCSSGLLETNFVVVLQVVSGQSLSVGSKESLRVVEEREPSTIRLEL